MAAPRLHLSRGDEWGGSPDLDSTCGAFLFAAALRRFPSSDLVRNLRPTVSAPIGASGRAARSSVCTPLPTAAPQHPVGAEAVDPLVGARALGRPPRPDALPARHGDGYARDDRHVADRGDAGVLLRLPGPVWSPSSLPSLPPLSYAVDREGGDVGHAVRSVRSPGDPPSDLSSDPRPLPRAEIGHGIKVPTFVSGPLSHSWWAMVILLLVAGSLYLAFVFSYLYLWTVSPQVWPRPGQLPSGSWPLMSGLLLAASSGLIVLTGRVLRWLAQP